MVRVGRHPSDRTFDVSRKMERAVTDPAALAPRVAPSGWRPRIRADPAEGFVHGAIVVRAEIVDVEAVAGGAEHRQDRVHAVPDVQVALALAAVAQHLDLLRVRAQLLVEIEHVSVAVPLAQDRHERKTMPWKPKPEQ
jgi:hypothetical protein